MIPVPTQRTFVITVDEQTAQRIESFSEDFARATPEAIIEQAVADALDLAQPDRSGPYRSYLGLNSGQRAMRSLGSPRQRRRRLVLGGADAQRDIETTTVNGFFGCFTFPADLPTFGAFCAAAAALGQDRSEIIFDAISIGMEGVIATAAAMEGSAQ